MFRALAHCNSLHSGVEMGTVPVTHAGDEIAFCPRVAVSLSYRNTDKLWSCEP